MSKENNNTAPLYLMAPAKKYVGLRSTQTMLRLHEYLTTPVVKDGNGNRRYSLGQLKKLRQIWLAKHPESVGGDFD